MNVKIDTKEKFHVITPIDGDISASMTAELTQKIQPYLQNEVKNVVLNFENVTAVDHAAAEKLAALQQNFYQNNASFVICCLQKPVEAFLADNELLEHLNVVPSQSEAWDIVQMEEIERELLDGE
ncbi:STAS domain-containing protein [Terrimonas rubra]|uniref:STAS domain-containing protein n=1 Tax=Terrimonas rubra TaxID=1035890 RepID=A0ABW6A2P1_9BACT